MATPYPTTSPEHTGIRPTAKLAARRAFSLWVVLACLCASAAVPAESALKPAPSQLPLEDLNGEVRSLGEFRGKVVLVNFWATWCPPCLREFPALERMRADLARRPFEILAVNSAEPKALVERFQRLTSGDLVVLLDSSGQETRKWAVNVFPTTFILDAQGRIAHRLLGEIDWDDLNNRALVEQLFPKQGPDQTGILRKVGRD